MSIEDIRKPLGKDEMAAANKKNEAQAVERAGRYHRVFVQNTDGAKLLEEWVNRFAFGGFTAGDASHTALAKAEARREFVAMIINEINVINRRT